jgi:hypothetical protein
MAHTLNQQPCNTPAHSVCTNTTNRTPGTPWQLYNNTHHSNRSTALCLHCRWKVGLAHRISPSCNQTHHAMYINIFNHTMAIAVQHVQQPMKCVHAGRHYHQTNAATEWYAAATNTLLLPATTAQHTINRLASTASRGHPTRHITCPKHRCSFAQSWAAACQCAAHFCMHSSPTGTIAHQQPTFDACVQQHTCTHALLMQAMQHMAQPYCGRNNQIIPDLLRARVERSVAL